MADVNRGDRPLSPHLTIYRPQLTSMTSILTRITGNALLALSLWALWYHGFAGLRHLYWDTGRGLDIEMAERLGVAIIVGSVVMTILTLLMI